MKKIYCKIHGYIETPKINKEILKAIKSILKHGDDRHIKSKKWNKIKIDLYHLGYLERRIGDWAWIPTQKTLKNIKK